MQLEVGQAKGRDAWKWSRLEAKLPRPLSFVSCAVTQDKKCVILVGGVEGEFAYTDSIFVFDVDGGRVLRSAVKCPNKQHRFGAVILSQWSSTQAQHLISGYLRQSVGVTDCAMDVVSVIVLLLNAEYAHVVQCNKGHHWRILVADLIASAVPV